jgi:tyrosine-protein kinase Etk/Wzc
MKAGNTKNMSEAPPVWDETELAGKQIDLLTTVHGVAQHWPFIGLMAAGGGIFALLIALILTPQFTSKAVFLPPQQQLPANDLAIAASILKPSTTVPYSGLLTSQTVLSDVVEHSGLQRIFKSRDAQDARVALRRITAVTTDTSGFVSIEVTHKDPKLAQQIANNYLAALARLNDRMAESAAAQQRRFFEGELEHEKDELENAEVALKKVQEESGVVLPTSQTLAGLSSIDSVRAQIRLEQVRLAALLQSQTDQSPQVMTTRSQIDALEAQLRGLEAGSKNSAGESLTASRAPEVNLEFVRLEREVKYHQVLFDALAKQFENARLEESSSAPGVQIVDYPELPIRKSWPPRLIFTLAGGFLGFLLALVMIFAKNRLAVLGQNPEKMNSLRALRKAVAHPEMKPWS